MIARRGHFHFHDVVSHWFYQIIPNDVWNFIVESISAIESLKSDSRIASKDFTEFLNLLAANIAQNVDRYTAFAGDRFRYDFHLTLLGENPSSDVLTNAINGLIVKDTMNFVSKIYSSNSSSSLGMIRFPAELEKLELDRSSPRDVWKRFAARMRSRSYQFGLTKDQLQLLEEKADTFSDDSLTEDKISASFKTIFKIFGTPNLERYFDLVEHDRANNPWDRLPPPPKAPPALGQTQK